MGAPKPFLLSIERIAGPGLNEDPVLGGRGLGSRLAGYSWVGHVPLLALFVPSACPGGLLLLRGCYHWGPG